MEEHVSGFFFLNTVYVQLYFYVFAGKLLLWTAFASLE